jgi:uncharacterized protein YcfJ
VGRTAAVRNVRPESAEISRSTVAPNDEERRVWKERSAPFRGGKTKRGLVSAWATVALVIWTQFGAERGVDVLTAASFSSGWRARVEDHPEGSTVAESNAST